MWTVSSASVLQKTCKQSLITSALYQTFPDDELVQLPTEGMHSGPVAEPNNIGALYELYTGFVS